MKKLGIGPKIRTVREQLGLTREDFASAMGVKSSKIQDIERQAQRTGDDFILDLVAKYGVDLAWLFDIEDQDGHSLKVALPDPGRPLAGDVILDGAEISMIKRFKINVSAGAGIIPDDQASHGGVAFSTKWLKANGIEAQLSGMVRVAGDSMDPTIPDQSLVLVHAPEMEVTREAIYAFTQDNEAFIKRLVPSDFDDQNRPRTIAFCSDNHRYPTYILSGEELLRIRIAGRVRCALVDF